MKKNLEDTAKLRFIARLEKENLLRLKPTISSAAQDEAEIYPCDQNYYDQRLRERELSVKSREIAEFFEILHTINRLLGILVSHFDLRFGELERRWIHSIQN